MSKWCMFCGVKPNDLHDRDCPITDRPKSKGHVEPCKEALAWAKDGDK